MLIGFDICYKPPAVVIINTVGYCEVTISIFDKSNKRANTACVFSFITSTMFEVNIKPKFVYEADTIRRF